jgi:histidine kinase 2/3/4 (cytokinin receptor)
MSGVAYADRVLHEDRESFEMSHGWTIKEMFSKEKQQVFEEYAPATMSQDTVSYLTSLDMMSGQVCIKIANCFWWVYVCVTRHCVIPHFA